MAESHLIFIISCLFTLIAKVKPWSTLLPPELLTLDIASRLHFDPNSTNFASSDFGKLIHLTPAAVFYPSTVNDIICILNCSYNSASPFTIAARGRGHSVQGQAMALNGVVMDMTSLNNYDKGSRVRVSSSGSSGLLVYYADVGGEQLWIDVLRVTLEHGLAPVSWTDYLYLTVGGTLSNGGNGGQSFLHGPQISNVYEMDVVTGKGELVTCSKFINSELFYAVLGGLGQFGIITRAKIALQPAPQRVKWVRLLYDNFFKFTRDQEHLISITGLDYLEGALIIDQKSINNWRSSFFSPSSQSKITPLITKHGIIYYIEVAKYYNEFNSDSIDEELQEIFEGLSFIPGFRFEKDVSFLDFLNRVRSEEVTFKSKGLWDVPHPWLNLFVPKSRIMDFASGVFTGIMLKGNKTAGLILVYPTNRNKWDDRMSAVTPDEDIIYAVGLLRSSGFNDWEAIEDQNKEILQFCEKAGIELKQYLPHYKTKEAWANHFGSKWEIFKERKAKFDPKMILSPGQRIFNSV